MTLHGSFVSPIIDIFTLTLIICLIPEDIEESQKIQAEEEDCYVDSEDDDDDVW